ncbi:hypothetical protein GF318_01610 [Candidatus Micrarchaeota archaeon]|nr:hypothetical protein [Candidatus Micrarchaeota archaeon]
MAEEYNVMANLKIYVEDPSAMDNVKTEIEKLVKVQNFSEIDVGFGIKALRATVLMMDSEGGMDELEMKIRELSKVSQVEVEEVSRV